jgi:hypothetical protein
LIILTEVHEFCLGLEENSIQEFKCDDCKSAGPAKAPVSDVKLKLPLAEVSLVPTVGDQMDFQNSSKNSRSSAAIENESKCVLIAFDKDRGLCVLLPVMIANLTYR